MAEVGPGFKNVAVIRFINQSLKRKRDRDIEFGEADVPRGVTAFIHKETGVSGEKGDRHIRAAALNTAVPVTGFRVQSRRNINRHLEGVLHVVPDRGVKDFAADRAVAADPEHRVHHDIGFPEGIRLTDGLAAHSLPGRESALRVLSLRFIPADQHTDHVVAPGLEAAGSREAVPAVIPRAAEDRDASLRRKLALEARRDVLTRALHQRAGFKNRGLAPLNIPKVVECQ